MLRQRGDNWTAAVSGWAARAAAFTLVLLLIWIAAGVRPVGAAGGDIVWQRGDSQAGKQQAVASAVDSEGNVIVTGYRTAGSDDLQTVKFNSDGSGIAWRATYDRAGGIDQALAVAVDFNDDVIVAGYSWNGQNSDVHTIKYDGATGAVIWQKAYNGAANGQDHGTAVAIDSLNNVYVAGYSQNGSGNDDYLILKYEPAGGALAWEAVADGGGIDQVAGLAVGQDGIAVTGQSWSGSAFEYLTQKYGFDGGKLWERRYASGGAKGKVVGMDGAGNVFVSGNINTSGTIRVYTAKYSGVDGSIVWERTLNGGFGDDVNALAVGSAGNVYITGHTTTLTGNGDFYTARYAGTDGQITWQQTFDSGGGNTDISAALAVDDAGDIFVTGYSASGGNFDFRTIKYKRDTGTLLWGVSFNGAANKNERAVVVGLSPAGDVLVAGWTDTASDDLDFYAIKYDAGSLDPPTGLNGTTLSSTSIRLDWTNNSATEEGFKIERKLGEEGTYAQVSTVGPGTATYTDTGLVANNAYYYRVRAYSAASGDSHYSNEIHALTVYVTYAAPAWSYTYNNPDNTDDMDYAIAVGPDGHPVVAGYSQRLETSNNFQTIKLNKADRSVLWSDSYDSPDSGFDEAHCIAAGPGGEMFVSGSAQLFYAPAQDNINSVFTLKYPLSGPPASWEAPYNGPGNIDDRSAASAVDAAGNLVVAGYGRNGAGNNDILLAKFNGATGSKIWAATSFDGGGEDFPTAITTAADGSIYVTGYSERTSGSALYDMFTARFDGATGELLWSDRYSVTAGGNNRGNGIAVDAAGNVYVAGFGTNGAGNRDLHTVKYLGGSASANRLWTRSVDGAAHGDDEAVAVKVDGVDGAIVVAGTVLTGAGDRDVSVIRYSAAGDTVWHHTLQRHDVDDEAVAMAMDASGYMYVAGTTANGVTTDILSLLYDYEGTLLDGTIFNGAANNFDEASSIAVNSAGEAFIAGYSTNAAGNYDLAVIKHVNTYLQMPSPFAAAPQVDYRKVNLSWTNNSSGTGLRIERTFGPVTEDSVWTPIYTAAPGTVAYQDTGLNANTSYCYRIEAYDGTLVSRNNVVCTTTSLAPPVLLTVSAVSTSALDVTWENVTGNAGYRVERKANAGGTWAQAGSILPVDTTVFHDTGLSNNIAYYYRVSAVNGVGYSLASNEKSAVTLPPAPSLNAPTGITASQMTLSWGSVAGNTGYKLERSTDNATWTQIATPAAGAINHSDTGLDSGTTYYYRLRTVNASGDSDYSTVRLGKTLLNAPVASSASALSTSQLEITWTDTNGGGSVNETGFTIEYAACTNGTPATCSDVNAGYWGGWATATAGVDATSLTIGSLTAGRTYRVRITATLPSANSVYSNVISGTTTAITQPVLNALSVLSASAIDLSWGDVEGESGYKVERKTGAGGTYAQVGSNLAADTVVFHDTGLSAGTTYYYRVSVLSSVGSSNEQSAITLSAAPSLAVLTGVTTSQISLSWGSVAGNAGYKVERSADNSTWQQIATPAQGATGYTDTGLLSGTLYYYRVKTVNASGDSAASTVRSATTKLQTPVLSSATAASNTQITLVWTDPNGTGNGNETGFTIEYAACTNSTPATCSDVNAAYWAGWSSTTASADSTTTTIGSLIGGRTYRFRVMATLLNANSGTSTVLGATTTAFVQPVLEPLNVLSTTAIDLSWNDVAGSTGYKLERKTGAGSFSQLGSNLAAGTVVYHDTGLTAGTTYTYRVSILNSVSGTSNERSAITLSAAPVLNALSGITSSQINLSWSGVTGNAGYKIERSTDNATWAEVATPAQGATGYSDTGVVSGTTYYYRVRTANASGDSAYSNTQSGTTKLVAPTLSSATAASISQITLVWTDPNGTGSGNETGFTIEYAACTNSDPPSCADVNAAYWGTWSSTAAAANSTTTTVSGLIAGRTYRFRVTANLATADSGSSNVLGGTTTAITPPVLSALTVLSTSAIDLSWGNAEGNSGYKVERKTGAGGTYAQVGSNLAADTVVFHDTGLSAGTVYYYRVSVLNAVGYSNEQNAITLPAAPVLSPLSGVTSSQIVLSWASVTGNAGYKVERSTDNTTWGQIAAPPQGATGHTDTGLVSGRLYYYRVKTTNTSGDSAVSNVQSATTKLQTPVLSSATASSTTQIALGWTDPNGSGNGNETGFTIEYAACTNGDPVSCSDVNGAYWGGWSSTSSAADSTSATIGSLTAGRTYRIRVTATLSGADSAPGTALAATTNLVGPGNLAVSAIDSSSVSLTWTDVLGETNYKVEQDGTLLEGVTLAKNSASYTVTGLSMNTAYCFRVQPYNGTSSVSSNQQCITIYGPPSLDSATVDSQTQVTLGWTDVGSETGYEVWRATPVSQSNIAGAWNAYVNLTATPLAADTVSYASTGLTAGYTYKYKIRYKLPDTTFSAWSNELQATTVPPAPAGAATSTTSTTAISVTWTDGVGETGYTVEYKPLAAATCAAEDWTGSTPASLAANVASHPVTGLAMGSTYCFRVRAANAAGSSSWTAALTQVTWLPAPTLSALSGVTPTKIDLTWSNVTGNTGYKIERSLNNSTWNQLATPAADAVSHSDTTVSPNQIYYYRISAKNSAGVFSVVSNVQSVTTPAYAAPVLTLSGMTSSQITLTWTDVFNTGYKIERSLNNSTWTQINTPAQGAVSYVDTGLVAATLYYYRIATRNNTGGYTAWSTVKSATTGPVAPTASLAVVSEARIDLTWQVVPTATNYKIFRSIGADGPWTQVANPTVAYTTLYCGLYTTPSIGCPSLQAVTTSYADGGLAGNTTYCYQLKSSNATGSDSTASVTVCGKTFSVGGPVLTAVTAVDSMKARLEWTYDPASCTPDPCGEPDGFEVEMRLWNGEWARKGRVTGGTFSFVDSKYIEPEKSYTYRVRARAGADASSYSNTVTVTMPAYAASPPTCP